MLKEKFPRKLYPTSSLARRIFLLSLCLLIAPLFLHTFFLYRQEYQQEVEEATQMLRMIGQGEKAFLEDKIALNFRLIDSMISHPAPPFIETPLPTGTRGPFVLASIRHQALLVGKPMNSTQALALQIPYSEILEQFAHFESAPYPVVMALMDPQKQLLAGRILPNALTVDHPMGDLPLSIHLSVSKESIQNAYERDMFFRLSSLLLFIACIGGFFVWLFTRRMARPLKTLCIAMQKVEEGALHTRYMPDWMGFEINVLGGQFNATLDALISQQKATEEEKLAREKLAEELRIGRDIQASLLPSQLPEMPEIEVAAGFYPAKEVGGDFYDFHLLDQGALFLAIADTAGKGIPACLYSLGLRSALRSFASLSTNLSEILLRTNALFCSDAKQTGMFATLWAAIYEPNQRRLTYCNQGHHPAFLMRSGYLRELTTEGIALGAHPLETLSAHAITLEVGDLLFLYTDGIIEAHDSNQQLFGAERLKEFLHRHLGNPAKDIRDQLLQEVHRFSQGKAQHDDLTAVALRIVE